MAEPTFKLERDGDQVGADQAKITATPAKEAPKSKDKIIADLQAENSELRDRIDRELAYIRRTLEGKQNTPVASNDAPKDPDILDQTRPFSKTRNSGGGIFYEQDGKKFDGKFRVIRN